MREDALCRERDEPGLRHCWGTSRYRFSYWSSFRLLSVTWDKSACVSVSQFPLQQWFPAFTKRSEDKVCSHCLGWAGGSTEALGLA